MRFIRVLELLIIGMLVGEIWGRAISQVYSSSATKRYRTLESTHPRISSIAVCEKLCSLPMTDSFSKSLKAKIAESSNHHIYQNPNTHHTHYSSPALKDLPHIMKLTALSHFKKSKQSTLTAPQLKA